MQKHMRGAVSFLLVFLLAFSMPLTALAEEYDLSKGSVTVDAREDGTYVTQTGVVTGEKQTTDTVITQSNPDTATTNTITVNAAGGVDAEVILDGVNVEATRGAAMKVNREEGSSVTVELEGDNKLTGGSNAAGLEVSGDGELEIADADGDGSLTAQGGENGAGIGGSSMKDGSNITVSGGTVNATGGYNSAGIGGGNNGGGSNITVSGGTVNATGGYNSAGIGGGCNGSGSNITVCGGRVTAMGGTWAAGIGGGYSGIGS